MQRYIKQILKEYLDIAYRHREKLQIILVCNVDGLTVDDVDYSGDSIRSEYLTLHQYNKILSSLRQEGFDVLSYFDESEFMNDVISKRCEGIEYSAVAEPPNLLEQSHGIRYREPLVRWWEP